MVWDRQVSDRRGLRTACASARRRELGFESLEARRLLVIVASGAANDTAASLVAYDSGAPGNPNLPGFDNVGLGSTANSSVLYLGGGWVLTAKHVTIANPSEFTSPGGVFFGGQQYFIDTSSISVLHDPITGGVADLKVFKIYDYPDLPGVLPAYLPTSGPAGQVYMIGNGLTRGDMHFWNSSWQEMPPYLYSGFDEISPRDVRWGENVVYETEKYYNFGADSIRYFSTHFSSSGTPLTHEAQASLGDSGGPVFSYDGSKWVVSGVMITTTAYGGQPGFTAVYGNTTWAADLAKYRDEILSLAGVVGRQVFYNQSAFDGDDAGINAADDAAIADDKLPYMPGGGTPGTQHVTSYSRGINGVMVDLATSHGSLSASDFTFRMSPQGINVNNTPSSWVAAPAPVDLQVRPGEGEGDSDRVVIVWPEGAIVDRWLEVTVKGDDAAGGFNTNTALAKSDIFYFGNKVGDTFLGGSAGFFATDAIDQVQVRSNQGVALSSENVFDFNRDALVDATDQIIARNNQGYLVSINISNPPAGPLPEGESSEGEGAVASALAGESIEQDGQPEAPRLAPPVVRAADAQGALRERVYELVASAEDASLGLDEDRASEELDTLLAELASELESRRLL